MRIGEFLGARLDEAAEAPRSLAKPAPRPKKPKRNGIRSSPRTAAKKRARGAVITSVHDDLEQRDRACIACKDRRCRPLHMHEFESRAQLRGKAPEVIFNADNCGMVGAPCHRRLHGEYVDGYKLKTEGNTFATRTFHRVYKETTR